MLPVFCIYNVFDMIRDVENPAAHEVEDEYWKIVAERDVHLQVPLNPHKKEEQYITYLLTYFLLLIW